MDPEKAYVEDGNEYAEDENEYAENENGYVEDGNEDVNDYAEDQNGYDEGGSYHVEEPFVPIVRYDPSKKSHKQFELAKPSKTLDQNDEKDDKNEKENKLKLSKKLYLIDDSVKDKFSGKNDFSFLSLFGPVEPKKQEYNENLSYIPDSRQYVDLYDKHMDHHEPRHYNDYKKLESSFTSETTTSAAQPWWSKPLFFNFQDDTRLSQGVAFFNEDLITADPEEHKKERNEIKNIIRTKIRNNEARKSKSQKPTFITKKHIYALKTKYHKKKSLRKKN